MVTENAHTGLLQEVLGSTLDSQPKKPVLCSRNVFIVGARLIFASLVESGERKDRWVSLYHMPSCPLSKK